jgi:hypothetical protein
MDYCRLCVYNHCIRTEAAVWYCSGIGKTAIIHLRRINNEEDFQKAERILLCAVLTMTMLLGMTVFAGSEYDNGYDFGMRRP